MSLLSVRGRVLLWGVLAGALTMMVCRISPHDPAPTAQSHTAQSHPAQLLANALQPLPALDHETQPAQHPGGDLNNRLRLLGTAVMTEPVAWIEDRATRATREVREGDEVLDARLTLIARGSVWLQQGGRRVQLHLEDGEEHVAGAATASQPLVISRAGASSALVMRMVPQLTDRRTFEGLRVESLPSGAWWTRLGLREGDLIVAVNDQALTSLQQALQVLRKAMHQSTLAISLKRNDALHTVQSSLPL